MSNLKTRDSAKNAIKRYMQQSKNTENLQNRDKIDSLLKLLEEQWSRFKTAQDAVESSCGDAALEDEESGREQAELWYIEALSNLQGHLRTLKAEEARRNEAVSNLPVTCSVDFTPVRLPKMELPSFHGSAVDWISFRDSFMSLIDSNANLSGVQKLHYLRSSLKGEALGLIHCFEISDANYKEAWNLLKSRYEVLRVIMDHHIRAIFAIERASSDSATAIKTILDTVVQHTRALAALGRPVQFWDDWLIHLVVSKLSVETRKQWELSLTTSDPPCFDELQKFLETRCRSLAMVTVTAPFSSSQPKYTQKNHYKNSPQVLYAAKESISDNDNTSNRSCLYCKSDHLIYTCPEFGNLTPNSRLEFVERKGACLNCLSDRHQATKCRSLSSCRVCQSRHHTALHYAVSVQQNVTANTVLPISDNLPSSNNTTAPTNTILSHQTASSKTILLATIEIQVQDNTGRWQKARALLDNGSHASFITESFMQRLGLPRKMSSMLVTGIGATPGGKSRGEAILLLASRTRNQIFKSYVHILNKITKDLPTSRVKTFEWPHINGLPLADPQFATPGPIDVLFGMDEIPQFLTAEIREGPPGTPIAQNTTFGWILFGCLDNTQRCNEEIHSLICDTQLVRAVSRFWELEELPPKRYLSTEEAFCEKFFDETHRRASDGRYIVRLPFKQNVPLGRSREFAVRSFLRLEKRLGQNSELSSRYEAFMEELLYMNHMEPVFDMPNESFYMSHHPVIKENSSTTKLRVVFNASMRSSTGYSLNYALMVGPKLQSELFTLLLRFRKHKYAMTADIAKMYRQVYVSKACTDYQRIVWRRNPSAPLQDYRLLRVTYGLASASHLAVKALQQTAKDLNEEHTQVAQVVLQDFYMDDLLTGASNENMLIKLQKDICQVLLSGGFELRKWATNCPKLLANLPDASEKNSHFLADKQEVRALGIIWNTSDDYFTFEVNMNEPPQVFTKRTFLSDASTLFDPLGFIAPCTIKSKIWLQQIWRADVDWDQAVPPEIGSQWLKHRSDLVNLNKLKLTRWLGTGLDYLTTELHAFSDASERAYAAVVYSRTMDTYGKVTVTLVAARTKLWLCFVPCFRLVGLTVESLAWLQGHPSRWSTFVANRVAEIQEVLPPECWARVRSEHNPADCASRGVSPSELLQIELWWQGPHWLKSTQSTWTGSSAKPRHTTDLEVRAKGASVNVTQTDVYWELFSRYSSYSKLKRITAHILRFIYNSRCKSKTELREGPLVADDIKKAELALIKYDQNYAFSKEISHCEKGKQIPLRSSIIRLQPFLDKNGVLRVGGRLKNANISIDTKHPVILSKNSPLAKLIVAEIHIFALHAGPNTMQTLLQCRFWVISSRNLVRKVYHNCVKCTRLNRLPLHQIMGDLPINRTIYSRCFLRSAVDCAGPYPYKFAPGRGSKSVKGYIAVFICMGTGAMHLEFLGDLSSISFLNAFKRFINRRGYCRHMHSDNGTNFVGAERVLKSMLRNCIEHDKSQAYFADHQISWHFNPPSAPHMGGYWEAGVKRVKYHLKRAIASVLLTFEEFSTVLSEVEACVNSRPLCSHVVGDTGFEVLTPGHFLVGEPLKSLPELEPGSFKDSLVKRWQVITAIRQHFWRRWRNEYLISLQKRAKWLRPTPNLEKDDIVIIIGENTPSTKWKLARVIDCNPGTDGLVRVARLKTAEGELVRPVAKLCRLPSRDDIFSD